MGKYNDNAVFPAENFLNKVENSAHVTPIHSAEPAKSILQAGSCSVQLQA